MKNNAPNSYQQLRRSALNLARALRDEVIQAYADRRPESLAQVVADGPGDTVFAIDRVSEEKLVALLEQHAAALGGVVLVAEGLPNSGLVLPTSFRGTPRWRFLVDPIDGTRPLMYQKRSAWVLIGVAPNRGVDTRLSDIQVAVQVEIPLIKQHLCDELSAVRGHGTHIERYNRLTGGRQVVESSPSRSNDLDQGYAMLTRFFPGAREQLAGIDDELMLTVLGAGAAGKALCFEDQYASSAGQLYELLMGHDRFNADLRPLMDPSLRERGLPEGLCCHPYDLATVLVAQEAGVIATDPHGNPVDAPFDIHTKVAWVGYANQAIRRRIEPELQSILKRRALLPQKN